MLNKLSKIAVIVLFFLASLGVNLVYEAMSEWQDYRKAVWYSPANIKSEQFWQIVKDRWYREWFFARANFSSRLPQSKVKKLELFVNPKSIEELTSNLPESGLKHYKAAYLRSDNTGRQPVDLRLRGDSYSHWLYDKKSYRIKFKKGFAYNGARIVNLISPRWPEFFVNYCAVHKLARQQGVLSPDCDLVRLSLNGVDQGLYLLIEQVNENFLRKMRRAPGSLYYGDHLSGPTVGNGESSLWYDAKMWEKKGSKNAEEAAYVGDIETVVVALTKYNDEFLEFFNNHINEKALFTFMAIDALIGVVHHDASHNHKLYFDPYTGRFEPIEWDIGVLNPQADIMYASYNRFVHRISMHPELNIRFAKFLFEWVKSFDKNEFAKELQYWEQTAHHELASDVLKLRLVVGKRGIHRSVPYSEDYIKGSADELIQTIRGRAGKILENYTSNVVLLSPSSSSSEVLFEIQGEAGVRIERSDKSYVDLYPQRTEFQGNFGTPFFAGRYRMKSERSFYRLVTDKIHSQSEIQDKWKFYNLVTGAPIIPKVHANMDAARGGVVRFKQHAPEPLVLKGEIHIDKDTVISDPERVIIEPGTHFLLAEGVYLIFRTQVLANGTASSPIVFRSKIPGKAFSAVSVEGEKTRNTKLRHVQISGGKGGFRDLIRYTGQLNLISVEGFLIDGAVVGKNIICDDSLHVAYGSGVIKNSQFLDANMDAIDIDIAKVDLINNKFYNVGNDGIDLMTAEVSMSSQYFSQTGDKCLSMGEGSQATIKDSYLIGCGIGIEVKEDSYLEADNVVIRDPKDIGINLYRKNLQYSGGGTMFRRRVSVSGAKKEVQVDEFSKVIEKTK